MKTAILVDGGFYRRRSQIKLGDVSPQDRATELEIYCRRHLNASTRRDYLYRIFYYDCPPMSKKVYHPLLKRQVDFSKTDLYKWMSDFLGELITKRKFALRLGKLSDTQASYSIRQDVIKQLCNGNKTLDSLSEDDFTIQVEQKGVDMKIGLDIASMAYKRQVDRIVLISGDSDFVPAAKMARREGIDFILDPLGAHIKPDLMEHIDGLRTCDNAFKNH